MCADGNELNYHVYEDGSIFFTGPRDVHFLPHEIQVLERLIGLFNLSGVTRCADKPITTPQELIGETMLTLAWKLERASEPS